LLTSGGNRVLVSAVIVVVVTTVVMVPMTDGNHDLGVCGLRKRDSKNQSEHGKEKKFHTCVDGEVGRRVVVRAIYSGGV